MSTSAERMRAVQERERRGFRRYTMGVSEDDLRAIAERGYKDAASTDQDRIGNPSSLFITDASEQFRRSGPRAGGEHPTAAELNSGDCFGGRASSVETVGCCAR